jgi:flagellar protein FlbD
LILLTQLNGDKVYVNPSLMETVESTPDTMITLVNGKKLMVAESAEEVVGRFTDFAARVGRLLIPAGEESPWT